MITLTGRLICKNEAETALIRRYLPEHIRLTKAEAGCLAFDVTETDNPLIWQVSERFTHRDAFELHQQRTRASVWGEETQGIAREYAIDEVA